MDREYLEEFVTVNGTEQYLLHYAAKEEAPVLLYLHGGPGAPEHLMAYKQKEMWKDAITLVHWDQRGAGQTLNKNKKKSPESIEQMEKDLDAVVEYLKKKYQKDKIILLGHSWGTILGSVYALQHPENVLAYIGSGQMVDGMENERVGYEQLCENVKKSCNEKHAKMLEEIKEYPAKDIQQTLKYLPKVHKMEMYYTKSNVNSEMSKIMKKSPCFRLSDVVSLLTSAKANQKLITEVLNFQLREYGTKYEVPVFYILGEKDNATPTSVCEAYFETITAPKKELVIIKEAGHNLMYEQSQKYAEQLLHILKNEII